MVDVEVASEESACVGWGVFVEFSVKCVEGVVRVVRWSVVKSKK